MTDYTVMGHEVLIICGRRVHPVQSKCRWCDDIILKPSHCPDCGHNKFQPVGGWETAWDNGCVKMECARCGSREKFVS